MRVFFNIILMFVSLFAVAEEPYRFVLKTAANYERFRDPQGYVFRRYLGPEMNESHCYYLPKGWTPVEEGGLYALPGSENFYPVSRANCVMHIRLGLIGHHIKMKYPREEYTLPPSEGEIVFDNHQGNRSRCTILPPESRLPIPRALVEFAERSLKAQDGMEGDFRAMEEIIENTDVLRYLDQVMPVECAETS